MLRSRKFSDVLNSQYFNTVFTSSVCIHNPVTKLTPQQTHTVHKLVFKTQSHTSPQIVPITPSVCLHNPVTKLSSQLSQLIRQSVFAPQYQPSPHGCLTHSVRACSPTINFCNLGKPCQLDTTY
jgi:hypothetical protein